MSDLSDLQRFTPETDLRLERSTLEKLALQFARRERELFELGRHIDRQQDSLAEIRGLLLQTLWPHHFTKGI